MKCFKTNLIRSVLVFIALSSLIGVKNSFAQKSGDEFITILETKANEITVKYWNMTNPCVSPTTYLNVYRDGSFYQGFNYVGAEKVVTVDFSHVAPNSTHTLGGMVFYYGGTCNYQEPVQQISFTLANYQPVANVQATDNFYGDKVVITWATNEIFDIHSYNIYCNDILIASNVSGSSYTHTNPIVGQVSTYKVQGVVNGVAMTPLSDEGSAFDVNFRASTDAIGKVVLEWDDFTSTQGANGYFIKRNNGIEIVEVKSSSATDIYAYHDAEQSLVPGFMYEYIFEVEPNETTGVVVTTNGKVRPNGIFAEKFQRLQVSPILLE